MTTNSNPPDTIDNPNAAIPAYLVFNNGSENVPVSTGTPLPIIGGMSGYSGYSGISGYSGVSGYSGSGISGYSGSGISGFSGISGYSGWSGISGYSGTSVTAPVLFADLPAGFPAGARAIITDCTTETFNAAAAGTGSFTVPVYCDGSAWYVG